MFVETPKTVMLFGSFDGIHPGHEFLVNSALRHGSNIILVVAQDVMITQIKKRTPVHNLNARIQQLSKRFPETTVIAGDIEQGTWSAIKKYKPNTIMVGYDQNALNRVLKDIQDIYSFELVQADAFFPEKYKSSLLREK